VCIDWFSVAQDRNQWGVLVTAVMDLDFLKCLEVLSGCTTGSLSRRAYLHRVR
jgi:hypothetical protein